MNFLALFALFIISFNGQPKVQARVVAQSSAQNQIMAMALAPTRAVQRTPIMPMSRVSFMIMAQAPIRVMDQASIRNAVQVQPSLATAIEPTPTQMPERQTAIIQTLPPMMPQYNSY